MTQAANTFQRAAPDGPPDPGPSLPRPGTQRIVVQQGPVSTTAITARDVAALQRRKSELSNQLSSATHRRAEAQSALRKATSPVDRAGLEQRLGVLDARIARLEADIDQNSSQLASLDVARFTSTTGSQWEPGNGNPIANNGMPIAIVFVIFVLSPLAIALSRSIWKRGSRPVAAPGSAETAQRLERIEQAVDAIAIEVERVSEGQRFVTRLLSDARSNALATGEPAMEPVRVAQESLVERR